MKNIIHNKLKYLLRGMMFWKLYEEFGGVKQQFSGMCEEVDIVRQQIVEVNEKIESLQLQVREACEVVESMKQQVKVSVQSKLDAWQQNQLLRNDFLSLRYHLHHSQGQLPPSPAIINKAIPISEQFNRLQKLAPRVYADWRRLLDETETAYDRSPIDRYSIPIHPTTTLFRFFIAPYLKGRVLDIGCGPHPIPVYLEDYPVEAVYGVDPLSESDDHPFYFIKGVAEFLPWANDQFNLVVAAISLDQVLLLDNVLEEVHRVLTKDGVFAVWDGLLPESKFNNPNNKEIDEIDNSYLFHFDRSWFMDMISPYFTILEEYPFTSCQACFFALRPKKSA